MTQQDVEVATILPETMMSETTDPVVEEAPVLPKTAGEQLRETREAQGLSLAEIAARTRVPVRQLEAIETGNFSVLPSVTYSVGFAKAYARAIGMDEVAIARDVRAQNDAGVRRTEYEQYNIDEPSRMPSTGVVIAAVLAVVLLLVAVGLWYGTSLFRGTEEAAPAPTAETEIMPPAPVVAPTPAAPAAAQVALVATDEVWLRVYDATGKTLFQNTLKAGERYEVPADADGPMINVGRPDKLQVTLNGSALPPLGDGRVAIKDVGISAAALTARSGGATPAASAPTAAPPSGDRSGGSSASVPPAFRAPARTPARAPARAPAEPRLTAPGLVTRTSNTPPAVTINPPAAPAPAPAATSAPPTTP